MGFHEISRLVGHDIKSDLEWFGDDASNPLDAGFIFHIVWILKLGAAEVCAFGVLLVCHGFKLQIWVHDFSYCVMSMNHPTKRDRIDVHHNLY